MSVNSIVIVSDSLEHLEKELQLIDFLPLFYSLVVDSAKCESCSDHDEWSHPWSQWLRLFLKNVKSTSRCPSALLKVSHTLPGYCLALFVRTHLPTNIKLTSSSANCLSLVIDSVRFILNDSRNKNNEWLSKAKDIDRQPNRVDAFEEA